MAAVTIIGGGICGLTSAMILARHGHEVTVLERNPEPAPASLDDAWDRWERPGCGQFRMGHWFLARFRQIIHDELPDLEEQFIAAGAFTGSMIDIAPMPLDRREDDDRFTVVTGRRPVFECVTALAAEQQPNLEIRRGVSVEALLTGPSARDGIPHVTGVRTEQGDEIAADVVLDAGGRRSALPRMLEAIGAAPMYEESEDCGYRYYGRYFRQTAGGATPPYAAQDFAPSVSTLLLPADNDTWFVGVSTSSKDKALYPLGEEARWQEAVSLFPSLQPWIEAEPITDVETMIGIPDRYRRIVVDGAPVATGVFPIGDAWVATNPSLGRGVSMGLLQAMGVIEAIDAHADDPYALALAADETTEREATPFYAATLEYDQGQIAGMEAAIAGTAMPEGDPGMNLFMKARWLDQDVFRAFGEIFNVLKTTEQAIDERVMERMFALADHEPPPEPPGPGRADLLAAAGS